jgi:hypothetical protein
MARASQLALAPREAASSSYGRTQASPERDHFAGEHADLVDQPPPQPSNMSLRRSAATASSKVEKISGYRTEADCALERMGHIGAVDEDGLRRLNMAG